MELITPLIRSGGCDTVYVMPNLQPPITRVADALAYHEKLTRLAPGVTFLMSLFLHPGLNAEVIAEAARTHLIRGVKLYPAGVTTNSQGGVLDIEQYYPVFSAMEEHGLILNLHGEMQSSPPAAFAKADGLPAVTVLNAEPMFLPQLHKLHAAFPKLRIVLEHVAGTITAHHLWMTVDDWCGDVFSFCKPVAKTAEDRVALVQAVVDGSGKFFFGSDSAPHPLQSKKGGTGGTAAGCFTQPWCTALVLGALEEAISQGWIPEEKVTVEAISGFLSSSGRAFYGLAPYRMAVESSEGGRRKIRLQRKGERIGDVVRSPDGNIEVVPFGRGKEVFSLEWERC
ncbi:MAG: hypothetical protein M1819_004080 [Sarea resinae]|nr:MAG: hypothetical protein M1819_004080 [Sarea resinae]